MAITVSGPYFVPKFTAHGSTRAVPLLWLFTAACGQTGVEDGSHQWVGLAEFWFFGTICDEIIVVMERYLREIRCVELISTSS